MATKKKTEADVKGKPKPSSPVEMQEPEAEKAPVEPVAPLDPLEREYPDLRQDIPKILKAILRELVIARYGNDR
jgi:hypothetical protein